MAAALETTVMRPRAIEAMGEAGAGTEP